MNTHTLFEKKPCNFTRARRWRRGKLRFDGSLCRRTKLALNMYQYHVRYTGASCRIKQNMLQDAGRFVTIIILWVAIEHTRHTRSAGEIGVRATSLSFPARERVETRNIHLVAMPDQTGPHIMYVIFIIASITLIIITQRRDKTSRHYRSNGLERQDKMRGRAHKCIVDNRGHRSVVINDIHSNAMSVWRWRDKNLSRKTSSR